MVFLNTYQSVYEMKKSSILEKQQHLQVLFLTFSLSLSLTLSLPIFIQRNLELSPFD